MTPRNTSGRSTLILPIIIICALASTLALAQTGIISIPKQEYNINEVVPITLNHDNFTDKGLKIKTKDKLYTYNGKLQQDLKFRTQRPGKHVITLQDREQQEILDKKAFNVKQAQTPKTAKAELSIDQKTYQTGEDIIIKVAGNNLENLRLFLIQGDNEMLYMGEMQPTLRFPAPNPSTYQLELRDIDKNTLDTEAFTVKEASKPPNTTKPETAKKEEKPKPKRKLQNILEIHDIKAEIAGKKVKTSEFKMRSGRADVTFEIPGLAKKLEFKNADLSKVEELTMEHVPKDKVNLERQRVLDTIAIDPSRMTFDTGTMTRTATGTELYKCKEWNYTQQECQGTWTKIKDLKPGQEYNITIGPNDPAFAEAGVATVNTRKPIYRRNELAEIVMAVLNDKGELVSGADVTLEVTAPDNSTTTLRTSTGDITETSTGVYETQYSRTRLEGTYGLNVTAQTGSGTQSMQSYFYVNNTYEFDIIRDTPVTIDPRFDFNSTITINPLIPFPSDYNYTEVLPGNFTIVDSGGATITRDSNKIYLTWTGLTGTEEVTYTADAPDIIPNVEVLGPSHIEYGAGTFEEARPWYMAIDPTLTDTGVTSNQSVVNKSDTITVTGNLFCSGGGQGIDYDVWLEDDNQQIDTTTSGRDFSCGGSANVTVTLCEAGSCTVNADCSVSVTGCSNNDDVDIDWILTAEGNNETLESKNTLTLDASISHSLDNNDTVNITNPVNDPNAPNVTSISPNDSITINNDDVTFEWKAIDDLDTTLSCDVVIDGTPQKTAPTPNNTITNTTIFGISSGSHNWYMNCTDDGGNSNVSQTRTFTVDATEDDPLKIYKVTDKIFPSSVSSSANGGPLWSVINILNPNKETREITDAADNYTATDPIISSITNTNPATGWSVSNGDAIWSGSYSIGNRDFAIFEYGFWVSSELEQGPSWTGGTLNTSAEDIENFRDEKEYTEFENPKDDVPWILTQISNDNTTFDYSITANASVSQDFYTRMAEFSCVGNVDTGQCQANLKINLPSGWDITSCGQNATQCTDTTIKWEDININGLQDSTCGLPPEFSSTNFRFTGTPPATSETDFTVINASLHYCDSNGHVHDTVGEHIIRLTVSNATPPSIVINEPNDDINIYDYNDITNPSTTNVAWDGTVSGLPPGSAQAPLEGTEASTTEYNQISSSDDGRWQTTINDANSVHVYHSFKFDVSESPTDVIDMFFTHEGFATRKNNQEADPFRIYIYNATSDTYTNLANVSASSTDVTTEVKLTEGFGDYINNGEIYFLVEGEFTTAGGANARADMHTDFVELEITRIPAIGGTASPINATVLDSDGVAACSYRFFNSTNQPIGFNGLEDQGNDIWFNTTDTTQAQDGRYTLEVQCNDTLGNPNNASLLVDIFNGAPTVNAISPSEGTLFNNTQNVSFVWNATEPRGGSMDCDLTLDGSVNRSVTLDSGNTANETVNNIADGDHKWNVTCTSSTGLSDTTETRNFTIDTSGPAVNLESPPEGFATPVVNQSFFYNVSDANDINRCSLFINENKNQTNNSITKDTSQNFTVTDFNEGNYNWSVTCEDEFNRNSSSITRNFTIDFTEPNINLSTPSDINFSNGTAQLNFTAFDNLDPVMTCNVTVDSEVKESNLQVSNGTLQVRNISLTDGDYLWNVTCLDDAGNINTSETRNFSVVGPPLITLEAPPNNATEQGTFVEFNYTAEDGNGVDACTFVWDSTDNQTDNNITNGATNSFNLSNIAEGRHNWTVRCNDTAGGERAADPPFNITIDRTTPNITLFDPPSGANTTTGNFSFNFTATDNFDPTMTCNLSITDHNERAENTNFALDNGTNTTRNESGMTDGLKFWDVSCVDNAGNLGTSESRNFTVFGSPNINLIDPFNASSVAGNFINFTYNATDVNGLSSCEFIFDDIVNQSDNNVTSGTIGNFELNNVSEGSHTWKVNCTDSTDQEGESELRDLLVDRTAPNVTANTPDGDTLNNNTIEFNFTVTDALDSTLDCTVDVDDGNHTENTTATSGADTLVSISNISEGFHLWNVTCSDDTPNNATSQTLNFTIDASPVVTLTSPEDGFGTSTGNVTFFYNASDDSLDSCTFVFDGTDNQTDTNVTNGAENNFSLTDISIGVHNWTVRCTDANNFSTTPPARNLQVDNASPNTQLNTPEQNATLFTDTITFNWTAIDNVDPVLSCDLRINGAVNKSGINSTNGTATTTDVTFSSSGNHTWSVNCTDNTGFSDLSETRNFTIESQPRVTLQNPADNYSDPDGTINFTYIPESFEGFNNSAFCTLLIDDNIENQSFAEDLESGEVSYFHQSGISEGRHDWKINCTDDSGANDIGGPRNFTIDLTDPSVSLNGPNGTTLNTSTVNFNWTATDNLDPVLECNVTVDSTVQSPTNIQSPNGTPTNQTISGFSDGFHLWNSTCADDAGRTNTSPETFNFTVQEPPTISLGAPANGTRTANTTLTLFYTPFDNSGSINTSELILNGNVNQTDTTVNESLEQNFTVANLTDGTYDWTVNATDPSGNEGTNATGKTFFIDLTGPNITLDEPDEGATLNLNNVTFNWTAIDFAGTSVNCTIRVSDPDGERQDNTTETSPDPHNTTIPELSDGDHTWNVTCTDDLGNTAQSVTRNFTINQPDLATSDGNLTFNNSNPDPDENITINLNVSNIGGNPANNVLVEFWDGNRSAGTFIGNDTINVSVNGSAIANTPWIISEGFHEVNAYVDPNNTIGELSEQNNNATKNISTLTVNITSPPNGTQTNDTTPEINFTMRDFKGSTLNYTIFVDGSPNGQTGNATDGEAVLLNLSTLTEGTHNIIVEATDPLGREKNSTPLTITIDATAPNPFFNTANNTFFNTSIPTVNFTITDNTDTLLNWTIYRDGTAVRNGTAQDGVANTSTLGPLTNGSYELILEAFDDAGNIANSTPLTIFVDQVKPSIQLNAPANESNFTTTSVDLNYTAFDNLDTTLACDVRVDGSIVNSTTVQNGTTNVHTATGLSEATHLWNVTCSDNATNTNTSETRNFNVFIPPNVTLLTPQNNTVTANTTVTFRYNVTDDTGLDRCELLFNGNLNDTDNSPTNNAENNFTTTFSASRRLNWSVRCFDNTTQTTEGNSDNRTLTVDQEAPVPSIETANNTWFNTSTPTIDFNITDNFDTTINYTIFVDGSEDQTGTVPNGTSSSDTLSALTDGSHEVIVEGLDDAGNIANSTSVNINVDTQAPNVTLLEPANDTNITKTSTSLNFTVTDNLDTLLVCDLRLDGNVIRSGFNVTSGTNSTTNVSDLSSGAHFWNATCTDEASNSNTSETFQFFVESPDLKVENVTFNESDIVEGDNITVTANISNIGNRDAENITVQFFDGDPATTGIKVNGNKTINSLTQNESALVSVNFTAHIGVNNLYAVVDPPLATNGSITEENESNNKDNRSFRVGHYNTVAGQTQDIEEVADPDLERLFTWNITNATGSNVFVADTDNDVDFTQLHPIGRNLSNNTAFNDYNEADIELNSTAFNDSINATWTEGGAAKALKTFTVFGEEKTDVPIVNSTNTSNFVTGLMWDTSDGGSEYNGSQDLILITEINEDKTGQFGTYDYEVKVPATLRDYRTGTSSVTFYTEIK